MTLRVPVKPASTSSSRRHTRSRRDFVALEHRRMRAAELFERDVIPAEIARQVGVSHQIVSDWRKAWRRNGRDALRSAGRAGRKPKLSDDQLERVRSTLLNGAEANGFATDVWTLSRVAEVIERLTGVSYHPGNVWSVLRDQVDWTWQRQARRAVERDDAAVERWVKRRWPQLKTLIARGAATERHESRRRATILATVTGSKRCRALSFLVPRARLKN